MKTVGEILKGVRNDKKLTLENVEERTKIRKKFLQALEENNWSKLPSLTYARGFIKNYAEFLELDSSYILSIFRRQMIIAEKQKILPPGVSESLNEPFFRLTPARIMTFFTVFLLLVFFFWLFGQYRSFFVSPPIILDRPKESEIIRAEKIVVAGKTDSKANLLINGQKVDLTNGSFNQEITVSPGRVVLKIEAANKFGRKTVLERTIQVEGP